jgi:two-component system NtrC family sensor kinase
VENQAQVHNIEVVKDWNGSMPEVVIDPSQMQQVFINLLINAAEAMDGGGRLTISTWFDPINQLIEVEFADTGHGIDAQNVQRIFDPFFTTKEVGQGTGLGLSVSYGIVQEHDGRIELARTGEDGSSFTVLLPLLDATREEAAPAHLPESEEPAPLNGCRILVAEDEPVVLELYARLLGAAGAQVTLARDGEEAWEEIGRDEFDLIVADLRMPNLDGQQLYERAAEERPDLLRRFVFTTGDLAREDTVQFLEGLPNRILPKPLQVDTVRRVLTQAIASTTR